MFLLQLSAAISASGELKIISELDTEPEASSTMYELKGTFIPFY